MCAAWTIAADKEREAISIDMAGRDGVEITQGDTKLYVGAKQLGDLADTLYFLGEVYKADVQDAVEFLLPARA